MFTMSFIFLEGVGTSTPSKTIRGVPVTEPGRTDLGGVRGCGGGVFFRGERRSSSSDSSCVAAAVSCRLSMVTLDVLGRETSGDGLFFFETAFFRADFFATVFFALVPGAVDRFTCAVGSSFSSADASVRLVLDTVCGFARPRRAVALVARGGCSCPDCASWMTSTALVRRVLRVEFVEAAGCGSTLAARRLFLVMRFAGGSVIASFAVAFRLGGMIDREELFSGA